MIRDPDRPIGTHVFTAMASNDTGLRWTEVTIDNGDDAKDALDRISIPKEVLDRIAPTALPRSSIIVSDEPLSRETNYRTEFIAVLSNQPQGGFITRRPTISFPPASSKSWNGGGFFSFFGLDAPKPKLGTAGGAAATIRCNGAGGSKRRHADRWPPGPVTGSTVAQNCPETTCHEAGLSSFWNARNRRSGLPVVCVQSPPDCQLPNSIPPIASLMKDVGSPQPTSFAFWAPNSVKQKSPLGEDLAQRHRHRHP